MAKIDPLTDITLFSAIAENNDKIEAALANTLSRDGSAPNAMAANLDMNSYRVINLPDAVQNQEPVTLAQAASIAGVQNPLSQENVGGVLFPRTSAETAAAVTPTYYYYPPGDVRRYGAAGDGVTNDATAIQDAVDSNQIVYLPAGTYKINSAITLVSNLHLYGEGPASIISAAADIDVLTASSKSGVVLRDFAIVGASSSVATDAVRFTGGSNNTVLRLDISGVSDQGVQGTAGCVNLTVRDCYFHGWQNKVDDSSDISFYNNCTYSKAVNNRCEGGGDHGIRFQLTSTDNLAQGNTITAHARYGILAGYETTQTQVRNRIIANHIEDITGLGLISGDARAGAGIYCVYAGSIIIEGNYVTNTNTDTDNETLNPSGIGVSAPDGEVIVKNNVVEACNWYGIGVFSNTWGGSVIVEGNTVKDCVKTGIYVKNHSNVVINGNQVINTGTAAVHGIRANGATADITNIVVTNNWTYGGTSGMTEGIGLEKTNEFVVSGNVIQTPQTYGIHFITCDDGSVGANTVRSAVTGAIRWASGCNRVAAVGGHYDSDGTYSVLSSGTGADNTLEGAYINPRVASNTSTAGLIINYRGSAAPGSGTWAVGDTVWYTAPTTSSFIGEVCTTAGTIGSGAVFKTFGATSA